MYATSRASMSLSPLHYIKYNIRNEKKVFHVLKSTTDKRLIVLSEESKWAFDFFFFISFLITWDETLTGRVFKDWKRIRNGFSCNLWSWNHQESEYESKESSIFWDFYWWNYLCLCTCGTFLKFCRGLAMTVKQENNFARFFPLWSFSYADDRRLFLLHNQGKKIQQSRNCSLSLAAIFQHSSMPLASQLTSFSFLYYILQK